MHQVFDMIKKFLRLEQPGTFIITTHPSQRDLTRKYKLKATCHRLQEAIRPLDW